MICVAFFLFSDPHFQWRRKIMICVVFFFQTLPKFYFVLFHFLSVSLLSQTDTFLYISCPIQLYYTDSLVGWNNILSKNGNKI